MKVIIRTAAEEDLHRIFDWIKQDNPAAATRMVARIRDRINFLELDSLADMGRAGLEPGEVDSGDHQRGNRQVGIGAERRVRKCVNQMIADHDDRIARSGLGRYRRSRRFSAKRVDVRVLVWGGAPLPLFRPSRREVREMRDRLTQGTRIRCGLDTKERPMHCHHEKTIVIDDRVAFVGGIDLTYQSGDRFDSAQHPARSSLGWHDTTARIEGPAVTDVAEHFRMRWHEVNGEQLSSVAPAEPAGEVELQIVRTVPEHIYGAVPRGDFRILESYAAAIRNAQRFIYLENQFLWSPEIARLLREKITHPPTPDFRLLLVLPSSPKSGNDDTRGVLGELIDADAENGRVLACALYARSGPRADPIYVHAKVGIVDDKWLTLGSANLNEHSLFNDTEMNIVAHDPELAIRTRERLWAEHLELPADELPADPIRAIDELWKPISKKQLERRISGERLTHRLVRLPHVSRRTRRMLGPLDGLVVDG